MRHRAARLILLLAIALPCAATAQTGGTDATGHDSSYALVAYVGGGWAQYISTPGSPADLPVDYTKGGLAGTVRLMWEPDHLLRLGIETGWTAMYSYDIQDATGGKMSLGAVPLLLVWSMQFQRFHIFVGTGYYQLQSNLEYGTSTNVTTWSMGWMAAAAYEYPLSRDFGLAGELKWMNATEHEDAVFSAQVQLAWHFLRW